MAGMSAAGGMGIFGSILGDVSGSISARERGRAIRQQGTELEIQADIEELNAKVTENDLRDQLLRTLASNSAASAASGVTQDSPSSAAAFLDDTATAGRSIKYRNLSSMFKVAALHRQARNMFRQGKYAIITGKLSASAGALGASGGSFEGMGGGPDSSGGGDGNYAVTDKT